MSSRIERLTVIAFGLALTAVAATRAGAEETSLSADQLLERHVQWMGGWAALAAIDDLSLHGRLEVAGLAGTITVRARRDGSALTEYDLGVFRGAEALVGESGWERNTSGQIEPLGLDKAARLQREQARTFGRHLRREGVEIGLGGELTREGVTGQILRFDYPGGDRYELLVDPVTGASEWSRTAADGRETWTRATDLRAVAGWKFAHRQEAFGEHEAEHQIVQWESVAVNSGLADALFARPADGVRLARLAGGAAVTDWLPIELFRERWIYVRGQVQGQETDILLDSGAGMTVLDRSFAERIGLTARGSMAARGTGGVAEAGLVEGVSLTLGGLEIGPVNGAVLDLSDIERRIGRPMPVILGKELFHAVVVDVDYPRARIRFHDPATFRYDGPGRSTELIPAEDGHKSLRISMEGGEPVVVGLDTGQGGALTVFGHYARERGFLDGRPLSASKGGGVGGSTTSATGTLASVGIAGYELRHVPVTFHQDDVRGAFDTTLQAGNLGAGILSRFRVLFDYGHDLLWLEPGDGFDAPLPRDRTGLGFEPDGDELRVAFVAPGSPAEAAGWKEGDRVRALDGESIGPDWWKTVARWTHAADGTVVRLTLADGTDRPLTLRAYY